MFLKSAMCTGHSSDGNSPGEGGNSTELNPAQAFGQDLAGARVAKDDRMLHWLKNCPEKQAW